MVIGGDLNVQLTPLLPYVGHGTGALSPERAPDAAAHTIVSTHSLVALNTWGTPGPKAHTFVFGKHQAQLDYVLVRQRHADGTARSARPAKNCPVGGWRHGGGMHSPIIASLPFHCKVFHKPPTHTPSIDAERIAQLAQASDKHDDPQVKRFRQAVTERIASVSTMLGAGQISLMVNEVARQHFPKAKEKTETVVRWQQSPVKQGIKEMWRAWRMCRNSTSNATLEAIFGRWRTWTSYYQLYKRHKERCRTVKKDFILEQMRTAEQAASSHNQRLLYQVVRSLAPKSRKGRPQLRDRQGQMLTRSEEAACFHQHFTAKFTANDSAGAPICRMQLAKL